MGDVLFFKEAIKAGKGAKKNKLNLIMIWEYIELVGVIASGWRCVYHNKNVKPYRHTKFINIQGHGAQLFEL